MVLDSAHEDRFSDNIVQRIFQIVAIYGMKKEVLFFFNSFVLFTLQDCDHASCPGIRSRDRLGVSRI